MCEHRSVAQIAADRAEAERLFPSDLHVTEALPGLHRALLDRDVERARACMRCLAVMILCDEVPEWLREQARSFTRIRM